MMNINLSVISIFGIVFFLIITLLLILYIRSDSSSESNIQNQATQAVKSLFKTEVRRSEPVVEEESTGPSEN
jgi:competence protein ComGC